MIIDYTKNGQKVYPIEIPYTTEEVRIGTWMGKPLYRKMTYTNNVLIDKNFSIFLGANNVDVVTESHFVYANNGAKVYQNGKIWYDTDGILVMSSIVENNDVKFVFAGPSFIGAVTNRYWYFIAEYTKTTD